MREWEAATWATGQTEAEVIRRVGKCVARCALQMSQPGDLILILSGKGNNGADARSAREHLVERRVDSLDVADPGAELSRLDALLSLRPALIIDGLFGIGLSRPLGADWIEFIKHINDSRLPVLAVDVPSGLNADSGEPEGAAVRARVTLTVGAPKLGLLHESAWSFVGRLEVAPEVGLMRCPVSSEVQWTLPGDFAGYPPVRTVAAHKGSFGHLNIIAGSLGYHGAAVLAARGAQRAQPGLITLHTLEAAYHVIASQLQAVMVAPWQPNTKLIGSVVLLGPGLAATDIPDALKVYTRFLWSHSELPLVVDASALDWLPLEPTPRNSIRVITPHPGEGGRLLRSTPEQVQSRRLSSMRQISKRFGNAWVVLKGHETLIGRSTGEVFVNSSGNPHMAQGGTGDTLSGFIAGLLCQPELQVDVARTLRYAVWEHGAAADRLQSRRPRWVVEDLLEEMGN
jgi:NAD(P)H-hydrate epimerase